MCSPAICDVNVKRPSVAYVCTFIEIAIIITLILIILLIIFMQQLVYNELFEYSTITTVTY